MQELIPRVQELYRFIAGSTETPGLTYVSPLQEGSFPALLRASRARDMASQRSNTGVHKDEIDLLLVMSINPGFGGQKFLPLTYNKIRQAKELITAAGSSTLIEIDGGVTLENAGDIIAAGADVLVAGNTVFSAPDPADMIKRLKQIGK